MRSKPLLISARPALWLAFALAAPLPSLATTAATPLRAQDVAVLAASLDGQFVYVESGDYQGWLDVDLVHNCFLMGEEVGELFKSIRRYNRYFEEGQPETVQSERKTQVAEEIVDVLNYLLAIANRLDIDVEQAFRDKNAKNQTRTWS